MESLVTREKRFLKWDWLSVETSRAKCWRKCLERGGSGRVGASGDKKGSCGRPDGCESRSSRVRLVNGRRWMVLGPTARGGHTGRMCTGIRPTAFRLGSMVALLDGGEVRT